MDSEKNVVTKEIYYCIDNRISHKGVLFLGVLTLGYCIYKIKALNLRVRDLEDQNK